MSTRGLKKWALLLTFWIALHTSALRAQLVGPSGTGALLIQLNTSAAGGQFVDGGTFGATDTLLTTGAGTRMVWYPSKAAFRAGTVSGTQWDSANLGHYSTAFGRNTTASGDYSTASGYGTTASGRCSTAMGEGLASNDWSTAFGTGQATGEFSTAFGYYNSASGYASTASGYHTVANGFASTASGYATTASGYDSIAFGRETTAIGNFSTASGAYTTASAYADFVLGRFNTGGGTTNSTTWVSTDPLFEVGNGTSGTHADALLLKKNGTMTVQGAITAPAFITTGTTVTGTYAVALGHDTTASGLYSTAWGFGTTAHGELSTAFGALTSAMGENSIASGVHTVANGNFSTASGYYSDANGSYSTASGFYTSASGAYSTAWGSHAVANGNYSTASGFYTTAPTYDDFVIGRYNTGGGTTNSTTWVSTDPLFEVGNGTSGTHSDALLLDKSGNMTVASNVQASSFHTTGAAYDAFVVGRYNLGGGTGTTTWLGGGINTTTWVATDPLFEVGNGTTSSNPGDALSVDKSGNVVAGGVITAQPGGDIPMFTGY